MEVIGPLERHFLERNSKLFHQENPSKKNYCFKILPISLLMPQGCFNAPWPPNCYLKQWFVIASWNPRNLNVNTNIFSQEDMFVDVVCLQLPCVHNTLRWVFQRRLFYSPLAQPYRQANSLPLGLCKGTVFGFWKTTSHFEIPSSHVGSQSIVVEAISTFI